ncbi:hypothetical protein PG991_000726 [Apiospora marii]|uniref:Uncharacterized protein n=1 Tax=Apiospora marii TaxID=335849 RepID=A0ABR1SSU6_9PEZI
MTPRAGDFHKSNQDAAYFTFDKEYAQKCAGSDGIIIRIDIPRGMLRQGFKFDFVPGDEKAMQRPSPIQHDNFKPAMRNDECVHSGLGIG